MYTVLDENLQVKGRLSLNNGNGATAFFSDTITTQMATDNANDPTGLTTVDYTNQDKQGNAKQWSHSLTVNVEATELGTSINTTDYLMYFDSVANHYYSMKVINATTDRNSGFITVSAINAAIFELGKQLIQAEQVYKQVDLKTFISKMYKNAPFSLRIADDNLVTLDYTVSANTSLQALLQDLQTKFDVDVDSWVEVDKTGHIVDRVLYFGHLGADNGELIRYGGAKGFENMIATEVSDIIYTKLYVTGKTDDKDPSKGHIGAVNNGLEYITDDDANQLMYAIGASQQQPVYLEGTITNNLLSEPKALLEWAKQQMGIFNHPRFNYTVTPLHDQIVAIGDTVTVQDFHVKPEILVTSKVIQKTTSFASPETNTFVLGEFSSIFTDNMNKGANVITLIKKDVTVVQEAADYAKAQADAAHAQAVIAQEQAIHAQTSADGKTTSYTANSVEDLPATANNGDIAWVTLNDGTHGYTYLNGKWVEDLNPTLKKDITDGVNKATSDAKAYADQAIATNGTNVSASIKAVDDKANKLKSDQDVFDAKAQGYANQALNDAKTNTSAAVQQTAKNASDALAQAKADLTGNIAKEATDRQNAVNALDKAAQGYANQAVAKEVSDRQNAVSALDSKTTGAINSARSDAQSALNALQVGGRNLFTGSKTLPYWVGSNGNATVTVEDFDANTKMYHIKSDKGHGQSVGMYMWRFCTDRGLQKGSNWSFSADIKGTGYINNFGAEGSTNVVTNGAIGTDWSRLSQSGVANNADHISLIIYFNTDKSAVDVYIKLPKLEIGNMPTAYTQAPEDIVQDYTNRDNAITQSFTQYQQTNDGKVTKAQSDATQALGLVATKVSQSDFDTKTGDLNTKYTNVKQTVDGQTTEIADIKQTATDQSAKINTISSDVDGTKQSISDIQTKDGQQDTRMGTIETSVSGVKSDFSTYKTSNDGAVKMAQTTAQTAVDGLNTKVSQIDYDKKTGDLTTGINSVTQTANKSSQDIVAIQQKDGQQDSRMTQIESDASGVKTTVSNLQTTQGKQSGDISTLQQRADGFDATVTKFDNLQVGGRNLLFQTKSFNFSYGNNQADSITLEDFDSTTKMMHIVASGGKSNVGIYTGQQSNLNIKKDQNFTFSMDIKGTAIPGIIGLEQYQGTTIQTGMVGSDWSRVSFTGVSNRDNSAVVIYFSPNNEPIDVYIKLFKLEQATIATPWSPAPEDIDSSIAKAQLTADQATTALSNYKTDADGRISKTQADIIATAKQVQTKVSQTDYDQKTGDLSTKVSTAQQTADSANTTIGDYKKANDGRVSSAESAIKQNTTDISSKVSQSDYNTKTGQIDANISQVNQKADSISQTIAQVSQQVNTLNQINLINNSEFSPDLSGWAQLNSNLGTYSIGPDRYMGSNSFMLQKTADGGTYVRTQSGPISISGLTTVSLSFAYKIYNMSSESYKGVFFQISYLDANMNEVNWDASSVVSTVSDWTVVANNNITLKNVTNAKYIVLIFDVRGTGTKAAISQPIIVASQTVGGYVPGLYNNNDKISAQQQTIDSINSTVAQQGTNINNITTRVQTAEGNISTAQNDISGLQSKQTQTADGLSQEVTDRQNGDSSVLQQGKDFTSQTVSSSENNMRSLINQKADSATIGVIQNDVSSLKNQVNWQQISFDDVNYLNTTGNYLVTSGAGTNSPFTPWFYIKVDAPRSDRITQTIWKDLDSNQMFRRYFDGTNWSAWSQVVSSATLLNIFHDSWSLGTSTNDGITKQLITGINGQPDGTLVLSGKSVILNSDTVIGNNFIIGSANIANGAIGTAQIGDAAITSAKIANLDVSKLTGDTITGFNINANRQINIAPGGELKSSVVNMGASSFDVVAPNINSNRMSSEGYKVNEVNGTFKISSATGNVSSSGTISVTLPGQNTPYKNGKFTSEYNGNNVLIYTLDYDNGDPNEFLNMSSAQIDIAYSKTGLLSDATDYTKIRANLIATTGNIKANGQISSNNITLNGAHSIVSMDGGRMYFTDGRNAVDLTVRSLSQSSLVSLKENFGEIKPDKALDETLKSDIRSYNFIGDSSKHISPMIDDVNHELYIPKDWLGSDGKTVDTYNIIGYLVQSIKALHQQIKELKQG